MGPDMELSEDQRGRLEAQTQGVHDMFLAAIRTSMRTLKIRGEIEVPKREMIGLYEARLRSLEFYRTKSASELLRIRKRMIATMTDEEFASCYRDVLPPDISKSSLRKISLLEELEIILGVNPVRRELKGGEQLRPSIRNILGSQETLSQQPDLTI